MKAKNQSLLTYLWKKPYRLILLLESFVWRTNTRWTTHSLAKASVSLTPSWSWKWLSTIGEKSIKWLSIAWVQHPMINPNKIKAKICNCVLVLNKYIFVLGCLLPYIYIFSQNTMMMNHLLQNFKSFHDSLIFQQNSSEGNKLNLNQNKTKWK